MRIQILTDSSSWLNEYNPELSDMLENNGHRVKLLHKKEELEEGDIAFFLSCFEIIDKQYLMLNKNNIVVHSSDLPSGKGWSPLTWQVIEGKNRIPVCLFEAIEDYDQGDVYLRDTIELDGTELVEELREKQAQKTMELVLKYVTNYSTLKGIKQTGKSSYYARRTASDSQLDVNKTIAEQFNLLRVADNEKYPAFFVINGVKYKLKIEKYLEQ